MGLAASGVLMVVTAAFVGVSASVGGIGPGIGEPVGAVPGAPRLTEAQAIAQGGVTPAAPAEATPPPARWTLPAPTPSEEPTAEAEATPTPEPTATPSAEPVPAVSPTPTPTPSPTLKVPPAREYFVTGYSYWDNDPPGSSAIAYPILHSRASGTGTFADPITTAVAVDSGIRPGARFYVPRLHKYLLVEDECATCSGAWLDLWIDGSANQSVSQACMDSFTGQLPVIPEPPAGLPVTAGPISGSSCTPLYAR